MYFHTGLAENRPGSAGIGPTTFEILAHVSLKFTDCIFFTAVEVLCEGSCNMAQFIARGLCSFLDIAVGVLRLAEAACGWISAAINFILTKLFIIHRYVARIRFSHALRPGLI